ncbi:MAG: methylmalonyl Co-A mutase-associated GTPase MeaB [Daejeonella sp.]|nr:methylmalonyl Co-A mutase-associated GTPase MeaB [Daejeonella sp.]
MTLNMSNSADIRLIDFKLLARTLTVIENDLDGAESILQNLSFPNNALIIGVTGPPGAGKSTLVSALIEDLSDKNKNIGVLAIDPTSPFNYGSLLGDRIRMNAHFNKKNVFIRSLATRGSLGGLSGKTIEMSDVLRSAGFDYVFIETVGVGQSEVEIAGLADITLVVLVPESGDEVQSMKSGLMEIADIFVVNKADREGADDFANNLQNLTNQHSKTIPVVKTSANSNIGISELLKTIFAMKADSFDTKASVLTNRAWNIIQQKRMAKVDIVKLNADIKKLCHEKEFNLYQFLENWIGEQGL